MLKQGLRVRVKEEWQSMQNAETAKSAGTITEKAREWVEEHYLEKFSLSALADALYINKNYLLRVFKAATGTTLLRYHNEVRCRHANDLLSKTGMSVTEIGNSVGYKTTSHFIKVYKQIEGCTPEEFRRSRINSSAE